MKTILLTAALAFSLSAQTHWVGTWAAAPAPQPDVRFHDQTLREIVHVSIGGDTVRVRLSNAFGPEPVDIGAAHLALRESGASVVAASDKTLTFSGRPRVQIPAGAVVISDPVKLTVPAAADLAISLYIPGDVLGAGFHASSQQTSWLAAGNVTNAATLNNPKPITSWAFLTGVDVLAPASTSSIVAFGDSITDGVAGVKAVILLEGINDIGHAGSSAPASETVTAEDIIAGLTQMIERAHEKGIRVIVATITPFEGEANINAATGPRKRQRSAMP